MAAAVFSPVVLWNAHHEWASFLFQSHRTIGQTTHAWRTVPEFWLVQLAILSPLVFAGLGWAAWRCMRQRTEAGGFALAFSLPLFAVFALASFHTEIHVNWTAPAFLSLLPALLSQALEHPAAQRLTGRRLAALTVISCLVTLAGGMAYLNSVRGWREIAERVETAEHELEAHTGQTAFVLGADKYNLAALLSFYTREPEEQVNTFALGAHGLGFRYWTDLAAWRGHPAIVIVTKTNDHTLAEIGAHFERLDPPVKLGRSVPGRPNRDLYLICGYGYRPPLGATTTAKTSDRLFR
jgi:dolichol-phosphate mannosyltransferase